MSQHNHLHQHKAAVRTKLKAVRANLTVSTRVKHAQSIARRLLELNEFNDARAIFVYASYTTEIPTDAIINTLLDQNKTVAVPKIIDGEHMEAVTLKALRDLRPDKFGIPAPNTAEIYDAPFDVALIPGLGFTLCGQRIGYGRGYYDRWLTQHTVHHRIALAYEAQIVATLPAAKSDIRMHTIVTEKRIIRCRRR